MGIKHVVFDWDGTLADTYPVISAAYDYVFKCLDIESIPYDEIKRVTSTLQNKDTMGFIFGERKEEAKKAYYEYIGKHHATELQVMPNANKLLKACLDRGVKIYLITNKKRQYFIEESDKLGFTKFFTNIVAAGDFEEDKPHPIATKAVFAEERPSSNEILVVGDGFADYQTARSYDEEGVRAKCAIYDPQKKYQGDKPDYMIRDLLEVVDILDGCHE